jgi:hypothetical protein
MPCTGDAFWIDEAWLSSQDAPRLESSGPLAQNLQNYEKELIEAAFFVGLLGGTFQLARRRPSPQSEPQKNHTEASD